MTKKVFKSECREETYTGWNGRRIRINAFYFDFKQGEINGKRFIGYKFMVYADVKNITKAELLKVITAPKKEPMTLLSRYAIIMLP